jgi:hypothetical protein
VVNTNNMDALGWLRKHLDEDGNDLLREMVREFAERLMAAEVDVLCGAGYGTQLKGDPGALKLAGRANAVDHANAHSLPGVGVGSG